MAAHIYDYDNSHAERGTDITEWPRLTLVERTVEAQRRLGNRTKFRLGFVLGLALISELVLGAMVLLGGAGAVVGALAMAGVTISAYALVAAELMAQTRFGLGPIDAPADAKVKAVFTDPAVKTGL